MKKIFSLILLLISSSSFAQGPIEICFQSDGRCVLYASEKSGRIGVYVDQLALDRTDPDIVLFMSNHGEDLQLRTPAVDADAHQVRKITVSMEDEERPDLGGLGVVGGGTACVFVGGRCAIDIWETAGTFGLTLLKARWDCAGAATSCSVAYIAYKNWQKNVEKWEAEHPPKKTEATAGDKAPSTNPGRSDPTGGLPVTGGGRDLPRGHVEIHDLPDHEM